MGHKHFKFFHESFRKDQIRLHPQFHGPRSSEIVLKVPGGLVGGGGLWGG